MSQSKSSYRVTLLPKDWVFEAPASQPLLKSAEQAGVRLPSSCRNGTCRTCLSQLHSGQVAYDVEWPGLSREEKDEGWILPCIAYPLSDLVLLAPAASKLPDAGSV